MTDHKAKRPFPIGKRGWVLLAILAAGLISLLFLDLSIQGGGSSIAFDFFSHAITPATDYESEVPAGTTPLLLKAADGARTTLVFAAAAMSLSIVIGIVLGFPAATAWWEGGKKSKIGPVVYGTTRTVITLMRSVHELLWAVLFLAAFGFNTFAAVVAIAIPYGGTLAKIFSEMIDEAPRDSGLALRATGASGLQVFCFGLLPRATPDMAAYAFYRFECAVRSSAILGFFGFQTLGYHIKAAFENWHYGEVWTYLYTLFLIVLILELWSGALRRRFVGYE